MASTDIVALIESAPSLAEARRRLKDADTAGLGPAFFGRVATLASTDPAACRDLAERWSLVSDRAFALRAKAVGERAAGKWRQAAETFIAAGESAPKSDRWVFSMGAIDSYARAGETELAVLHGRRAIRELTRLGNRYQAARARINLGNALTWQDREPEAIRSFREALKDLSESNPSEIGMAELGLSTCLLYRNVAEAARHAEGAVEHFQQAGMSNSADLAKINVAQAWVFLGRADEAVAKLIELRERLSDSPAESARLTEFLADAYVRLNLTEESSDSYTAALGHPALQAMPLNLANCRYGLAVCGNAETAAAQFLRAAVAYERIGNHVWAAAARMRAAIVHRKWDGATFEADRSALAGTVLGEEIELELAEMGVAEAKEPKTPTLKWRYEWLKARGHERPLAAFRRMFALIERDRVFVQTPAASLHFLDGRGRAIQDYVDWLLRRPNRARIAEAIEVLTRSRSVALLDEILAARRQQLPPEVLFELDGIRADIRSQPAPGARLAGNIGAVGRSLRLIERTWSGATAIRKSVLTEAPKVPIWICDDAIRELSNGTCRSLTLNARQISAALDWLEFFLFEPMVNRAASPDETMCHARKLAEVIAFTGGPVCPDREMWRIPWTLLGSEPLLLLNPGFGSDAGAWKATSDPRVAIWIGDDEGIPDVEIEASAILARFPKAEVLRTRDEVRTTYRQAFDIIHVLSHGHVNPGNAMFSSLQFKDGPIYSAEIARSGIRTQLAVVAACHSGTLSSRPFESEGLVRSFLACGANAAMGSLWPLDDKASVCTMEHFYSQLSSGAPLGHALAEARKFTKSQYPHPYFWGPLALFGGYTL